jgi:hypothetical protein
VPSLEIAVRIEPEDVHETAFCEPRWLSDGVLCLRFADTDRASPPYLAALLAGDDAASVMPEAPNRDGIAWQLDEIRKRFEAALTRWQAGPEPARQVRDVATLIRRTLAHMVNPLAIYSNGQFMLTLVELESGGYELARHGNARDLVEYCSIYSPCLPLESGQCQWFAHVEAAETNAFATLRRILLEEFALADKRTGEALEGSVWLQSLGGDRCWLLHHGDTVQRVRIGARGEPREVLRGLDLGTACVRCCATCAHFRFSGMSHDMSGGRAGYCGRRQPASADGGRVSPFDETWRTAIIVTVRDMCPAWTLGREQGMDVDGTWVDQKLDA